MYVVDASVWVGLFVPEDLHQAPSREWVETQFDQGIPLVAPAVVLPEVAGAIARRSGSVEFGLRALAAMQRFRRLRVIEVRHRLAWQSGTLAAELQMKGADSVYTAAAEILGLPLVSWDKQQLERASQRVRVLSLAWTSRRLACSRNLHSRPRRLHESPTAHV